MFLSHRKELTFYWGGGNTINVLFFCRMYSYLPIRSFLFSYRLQEYDMEDKKVIKWRVLRNQELEDQYMCEDGYNTFYVLQKETTKENMPRIEGVRWRGCRKKCGDEIEKDLGKLKIRKGNAKVYKRTSCF